MNVLKTWLGFCRQKPVSATHEVETGLNWQKLGLNWRKLLRMRWSNFSGISHQIDSAIAIC